MDNESVMKVVLLAVTIFISVSLQTTSRSSGIADSTSSEIVQDQQLQLDIPKASWEPIFFREIDKRAKKAKLASLRSALPDADQEVRIWNEAGSLGMDGIVIRRRNGAWSGTFIHGVSTDPNFRQYDEQLRPPRSGWDAAWKRFVEAGLLTLPDASQIQCYTGGRDMVSFVFETNVNKKYRTYMYEYYQPAACEEAKQMGRLVDVLMDEFDLRRNMPSP